MDFCKICQVLWSIVCVVVTILTVVSTSDVADPTVQDIPCNLTNAHQDDTCPAGSCCVRDDFLYTETYCKPHGVEGSNCATKDSEFECPCANNLHCEPNIHGAHASLFGKCRSDGPLTSTTDASGATPTGTPATVTDENGNPVVG